MAKKTPPIIDGFRKMLKTAPFVGIIVHTSDGDTFRISHPDYALIGPRGDLLTCYDDDQHLHILNPQQIVSIEFAKKKKRSDEGAS